MQISPPRRLSGCYVQGGSEGGPPESRTEGGLTRPNGSLKGAQWRPLDPQSVGLVIGGRR